MRLQEFPIPCRIIFFTEIGKKVTTMELYEKLNLALHHSGLPTLKSPDSYRFLGAGAWNDAYLVTLPDGAQMVVRFPKAIAYGAPNEYNEQGWRGDYEAAGHYYRQANKVSPGMCPAVYHCHVTPELTFTVESYLGKTLVLAEIDETNALDYGRQMGEFFRAMDAAKPELDGFGYLVWNDKLEGSLQGDAIQNLRDEKDEYLEELEILLASTHTFDRETVKSKLLDVLDQRAPETHPIALTNQDTSPENNIIKDGKVSLIDPFPIIYSGYVFVGNALHNKEMYAAYSNTERYGKHQFHKYTHLLKAMADGFLSGYVQGQREVLEAVTREHFLQTFNTTLRHLQVLQKEELPASSRIRMGDREAIEERLHLLLNQLSAFPLDKMATRS